MRQTRVTPQINPDLHGAQGNPWGLEQEAAFYERVLHPHVVRPLGVAVDLEREVAMLMMRQAEHGDLDAFLQWAPCSCSAPPFRAANPGLLPAALGTLAQAHVLLMLAHTAAKPGCAPTVSLLPSPPADRFAVACIQLTPECHGVSFAGRARQRSPWACACAWRLRW